MKTIGNRIREIKEFYYGTKRGSNKDFADFMGETPQVVSNWFGREDNIGVGVINKILEKFPDVDKGWLVGGNGEMFKAAELPSKSSSNKIGSAIGSALAGTVIGSNVTAMAAMPSLGIGGFFGSIISSIFGSKDDITEEEAVEVLKEVLEDSKRKDKEIEELKDKVEYWQEKANNLEYEMSKTKAG